MPRERRWILYPWVVPKKARAWMEGWVIHASHGAFLLHDPFYYNYVYNSPHTEPMKDEE